MAKKLKCWKKANTIKPKYIHKQKKGHIATTRLSAGLNEQVCIIDKEKNRFCKRVKNDETPNQALIKLLKQHDKC